MCQILHVNTRRLSPLTLYFPTPRIAYDLYILERSISIAHLKKNQGVLQRSSAADMLNPKLDAEHHPHCPLATSGEAPKTCQHSLMRSADPIEWFYYNNLGRLLVHTFAPNIYRHSVFVSTIHRPLWKEWTLTPCSLVSCGTRIEINVSPNIELITRRESTT
jgi:hypothetical protein